MEVALTPGTAAWLSHVQPINAINHPHCPKAEKEADGSGDKFRKITCLPLHLSTYLC